MVHNVTFRAVVNTVAIGSAVLLGIAAADRVSHGYSQSPDR